MVIIGILPKSENKIIYFLYLAESISITNQSKDTFRKYSSSDTDVIP